MNLDYDKDIRIDESSLDMEWLDQPSLMMKYARNAAEMRKLMDLAKENLDVVRAEIDRDVRENPERFGITKITDAVVAATVLRDKEYQKASKEFIDARYALDIANAAVRSMDARKDALENLVRLHGLQYFAGPQMPRNLTEMRDMRTKQINASIKRGMSRTRDNE